jgi:threonine aldolase
VTRFVDLRSDTVTRPTPAMRRAMYRAEVGDDVFGEDPTVRRLEELAAETIGKAAALFVPSGTMGNLLAVTVQAAGGEMLLGDLSHTRLSECGGHARVASSPAWPLSTDRLGRLDPREVAAAIHGANIHHAATRLLCLENAHNFCGGTCLSVEATEATVAPARRKGLKLHLDGARIFNAAMALGVPARKLAAPFDSVMFCLSKGLCSPVGSMLCGSEEFVAEARGVRKMLGGGMRQAGVLAACGIISIRDMTKRLHEDHANARFLAERLSELPGVGIDMETVQTNMVMLTYRGPRGRDAEWLRSALAARGVLALTLPMAGPPRLRLVTHHDASRANCGRALRAFRKIAGNRRGA